MSVTIDGARIEQLLGVVVAAASGEYDARVPLVEADDDPFLEVELGVNYLLEELAASQAEADAQRDELRVRADKLEQQQVELLQALATPIIAVWPGVLALPLVGRVDEERAAMTTSALLDRVAADRASHVILDLTGIGEIEGDTMPALLRMVRAIGLLGATCMITGISPAIAQQIVGLDAADSRLRSHARLADALAQVLADKGALRR